MFCDVYSKNVRCTFIVSNKSRSELVSYTIITSFESLVRTNIHSYVHTFIRTYEHPLYLTNRGVSSSYTIITSFESLVRTNILSYVRTYIRTYEHPLYLSNRGVSSHSVRLSRHSKRSYVQGVCVCVCEREYTIITSFNSLVCAGCVCVCVRERDT